MPKYLILLAPFRNAFLTGLAILIAVALGIFFYSTKGVKQNTKAVPKEKVGSPAKESDSTFNKNYRDITPELSNLIAVPNPDKIEENSNEHGPNLSSIIRVYGTMSGKDPKKGSALLYIINKGGVSKVVEIRGKAYPPYVKL